MINDSGWPDSSPDSRTAQASECFAGIQQNRYGPIVDELDLHHFLEAAGFAAQAGCSDALDKKLIQAPSMFRRSRSIERRALAAARVSVQGELRNRENTAADVLHAA